MGSVGLRDLCKRRHQRPLLLAISIGALAIVLALWVRQRRHGSTTTSVTSSPGETTTTVTALPGELTTTSTSTETVNGDTTTTTAVAEETTTSSTGAAARPPPPRNCPPARSGCRTVTSRPWASSRSVREKDGKRYITIDYAEMLTGQAAVDAAVGPRET